MKIHISSKARGSTLLMAMIITTIISATMGSYLYLLQSQNRSVMHSLSWNAAMPMAEAGVEEAMAHLAKNVASNLTADGWSLSGITYSKNRTLGDDHYEVGMSLTTNGAFGSASNFSIRATGYVRRPNSTDYASRTVIVGVSSKPLFLGLIAKTGFRLGGNFYADSYDSSTNTGSTGGQYDPAKKLPNAFIGTNSQTNNSQIGGSIEVIGSVATGPGGAITANGGASVGDASWPGPGIQPGHYRDDLNVQVPDVTVPFTVGDPVAGGTVDGTNYAAILNGGKFTMASLSGKVYVSSPSLLYVSGNVNLDNVVILPGAKLSLYVGGASTTISGSAVVNLGGDTENFSYYGLVGNTDIQITSDASIVGTIYAPRANIRCNGNAALFGAMACNTFTGIGNFDFHYDEKLGRAGGDAGFYITSWDEP